MKTTDYIEKSESSILHTYNRYQIVLEKGEGVYLYDVDDKKYLDFAAGIAVNALGYHHPVYTKTLQDQVARLTHISNLYYNTPMMEAGEKVLKASGMARVFFTNSGAEAIEGALKAAKKYAFRRDGHAGHSIIAMEHSFHGRTVGALSVTGNAHYREPFEPLMGGVRFAKFNDPDSVRSLVDDTVCAVILETIQGEGGIYPADQKFLEDLRSLCDEHDILLILDEIQCGMGRTGHPFAWQEYGVQPDIMTCAKALGNGIPVGAFVLGEKASSASLEPGDHGTTYGGNPLACAAVSAVFDIYEQEQIIGHVRKLAPYLEEQLEALIRDYPCIKARRGKGFMQGLVVEDHPVSAIINRALENGLLIISAGTNVLRLVPPLIIERQHIDEMIEKLRMSLDQTL